jgi:hypothetical protein
VAHVVSDIAVEDPSLTEEGPIDGEAGKGDLDLDQGYSGDQEEGGDSKDDEIEEVSQDGKKTKRPRLGAKQRQKLKEKKVKIPESII